MNILDLQVVKPDLLLIPAGALNIAFRLAYYFYVGHAIRAAQLDTTSSHETRYANWLKFKNRASFILNADGVTLALVIAVTLNTITAGFDLTLLRVAGAVLVILGIWVKTSAYGVIGTKGYYWYNFFCVEQERVYVAKGIYKYLKNPMYGLGYMHAFGFPLLFLSFWGLLFALFDWLVVWAFYFVFERRHTLNYSRQYQRT